MSTQVLVNTYVYSVSYVTDKMLTSLLNIIRWVGLDPGKFVNDWATTELGIKTWLNSQDLTRVVLEIYNPLTNALVTRWDFDIDYGFSLGDEGSMWADTDAIRNAILKCGQVPSQCDYRLIVTTKPGRPDVRGWGPAALRSTDGFVRYAVGTTIGTTPIGAQTAYWRKT